jgi:hypothetical protein
MQRTCRHIGRVVEIAGVQYIWRLLLQTNSPLCSPVRNQVCSNVGIELSGIKYGLRRKCETDTRYSALLQLRPSDCLNVSLQVTAVEFADPSHYTGVRIPG